MPSRHRQLLAGSALMLAGLATGCGPTAPTSAPAPVAAPIANATQPAAVAPTSTAPIPPPPAATTQAAPPTSTRPTPTRTTASPTRTTPAPSRTPAPSATATRSTPSKAPSTESEPQAVTGGAKVYKNCEELRKDYPHGVARRGGVDLTSGKPKKVQPAFVVNDDVYNVNHARDADGDGVACEQN
ncbi:excalibur calcium-binding domain-containing protein [Naumannella sp. ID2617S]|nr:excalibur calcium-binding domain-containing protein [Naumannella sp. ID2617S]